MNRILFNILPRWANLWHPCAQLRKLILMLPIFNFQGPKLA